MQKKEQFEKSSRSRFAICCGSIVRFLQERYWVGVQRGQCFLMGEGASLALVGHPSSDGVEVKKIPYGVDVLIHQPVLHSIFSY